tara:strand:+ start:4212 stop:4463 length:252 start_codon:yes stop_codon:yes gene_type:complete
MSLEIKANRASEILNDPVFVEAIEKVKDGYMLEWALTSPEQVEDREALFAACKGLDEALRGLRAIVASWQLEKSRSKPKREVK